MSRKKTKTELENEIISLKRKNEFIWTLYMSSLDQIADMRIREELSFEKEYEYILSGESVLSEEDAQIYLQHNYDRYKKIKKGSRSWKREWEDASTADQNAEC